MQKRRVLINALVAVLQVVVNGVLFFVLYRFLNGTIGKAGIGVWALVIGWTQLSHLANLGLSGSAVKFVSMHLAREDRPYVRDVIQTAALSLAAVLVPVLLVMWPILGVLIDAFVQEPEMAPVARAIVPYALASFWLSSVATVLASCVEGFQRVDVRNVVLMVGTAAYLGLAFLLVPAYGVVGLAAAQVAQGALLLAAYWLVLLRLLPTLPLLPWRWSRRAFREMLNYSLGLQAISFSLLLFEPVTKTLMTTFGGTAATGVFEMANKLVVQLRALVVTAHGALVPSIADLHERDPAAVPRVYETSFRLVLFLIVPALPLLVALTPVIWRLWMGPAEPPSPLFVLFADLLFAGWFLNMLANPAYFANLGTGRLRANVWGHALIGALNVGLGAALGAVWGAEGVVIGFVVALLTGSGYIAAAYHRAHEVRLRDLVGRDTLLLAAAGGAGFAGLWTLHRAVAAAWPPVALAAALVLLYGAVVAVPLWRHPARAQVQGWILTLMPFRRDPRPAEP